MSELPVDDRLCFALHAAARAMDVVYRSLLADTGLTYPQYLVLSVLWDEGAQGVGELARRLALDPSTLTPLVQRLEARGLVDRVRDSEDQRKVTVTVTAAGRALENRLRGVIASVCEATGMTVQDQTELVSQLRSLTTSLTA